MCPGLASALAQRASARDRATLRDTLGRRARPRSRGRGFLIRLTSTDDAECKGDTSPTSGSVQLIRVSEQRMTTALGPHQGRTPALSRRTEARAEGARAGASRLAEVTRDEQWLRAAPRRAHVLRTSTTTRAATLCSPAGSSTGRRTPGVRQLLRRCIATHSVVPGLRMRRALGVHNVSGCCD